MTTGSCRIRCAAAAATTLLALGCVAGIPAGCASTPDETPSGPSAVSDPSGGAPEDLSVEIDVVPGRTVRDRAKIEERPARFVLFADGSLHGEADRVPPRGVRPARIRRLEREQMADLWLSMRSAGFASSELADTRASVELLEPGAADVLVTMEVFANGERFAFVRSYKPGGDDEPAMRGMVRSVAALAWASDEALAETAELPLRYDLGADPYARFAKPTGAGGAAGTPTKVPANGAAK
jgi:hypothetical protein